MIYQNILECVGHTPMVRLSRMVGENSAQVLVKYEGLNVGGSIKTRTALNMINQAEKDGLIGPDSIIVEPTSGNQGIGLALVGAVRGYKTVIIMPDSVSEERRKLVDPDGYRIYGLGEWGEVGGLILTNYVIEDFDRSPERFDYMVNAQDFGFNHANCIGEVGFKDGELYLCQELYVFGKDTDEIIRLAGGRFQKRLTMYCDSAEPDLSRVWRKAGNRAVPVKKEPRSVRAQIDHLKQHKIHLHPSCVNTIKEIQQWKWRRDEKSGQYLDEPVNFFDDAMAMLRYSIEQERRGKVKIKTFKGGI